MCGGPRVAGCGECPVDIWQLRFDLHDPGAGGVHVHARGLGLEVRDGGPGTVVDEILLDPRESIPAHAVISAPLLHRENVLVGPAPRFLAEGPQRHARGRDGATVVRDIAPEWVEPLEGLPPPLLLLEHRSETLVEPRDPRILEPSLDLHLADALGQCTHIRPEGGGVAVDARNACLVSRRVVKRPKNP